jgi:hypothetical protein
LSAGANFAESTCSAAPFEVNSEPHTGVRPSVRLSVGLITGFQVFGSDSCACAAAWEGSRWYTSGLSLHGSMDSR